jgi:hypothetical protein
VNYSPLNSEVIAKSNFGQDIRLSARELKLGPPEHEAGMLNKLQNYVNTEK